MDSDRFPNWVNQGNIPFKILLEAIQTQLLDKICVTR